MSKALPGKSPSDRQRVVIAVAAAVLATAVTPAYAAAAEPARPAVKPSVKPPPKPRLPEKAEGGSSSLLERAIFSLRP